MLPSIFFSTTTHCAFKLGHIYSSHGLCESVSFMLYALSQTVRMQGCGVVKYCGGLAGDGRQQLVGPRRGASAHNPQPSKILPKFSVLVFFFSSPISGFYLESVWHYTETWLPCSYLAQSSWVIWSQVKSSKVMNVSETPVVRNQCDRMLCIVGLTDMHPQPK